MANPWTERRRRLHRRGHGLDAVASDAGAMDRVFAIGATQGDYGAAFEISPYTVMRRERIGRLPAEAALCLDWCAERGRLPTIAERRELDALRAGVAYRAQREALGLTQGELAAELGVSVSAVRDRENERRAGLIGRESALALMIVSERIEARRLATIAAGLAVDWDNFDPLDDATG